MQSGLACPRVNMVSAFPFVPATYARLIATRSAWLRSMRESHSAAGGYGGCLDMNWHRVSTPVRLQLLLAGFLIFVFAITYLDPALSGVLISDCQLGA